MTDTSNKSYLLPAYITKTTHKAPFSITIRPNNILFNELEISKCMAPLLLWPIPLCYANQNFAWAHGRAVNHWDMGNDTPEF